MTIFATDSQRLSTVVKYELEPNLAVCREVVTVNDAAQTYKVGAVLGKITASGKFKLQDAAAVDGSQTAAAIYIGDILGFSRELAILGATDTKVLVLARGPAIVAKGALTVGAGTTTAPQLQAVYDALKAVGISAETTV